MCIPMYVVQKCDKMLPQATFREIYSMSREMIVLFSHFKPKLLYWVELSATPKLDKDFSYF